MPLIILGLLLLIGLLIYSIMRYINSGEEEDTRPVRERYPEVFVRRYDQDDRPNRSSGQSPQDSTAENDDAPDDDEPETITDFESYVDSDNFAGDFDYLKRSIKSGVKGFAKERGIDIDKIADAFKGEFNDSDDDSDQVIFPTDNIEEEKRKRNINSK